MADSNVIAYLFPDPTNGQGWRYIRGIIEDPHNKSRYLPPRLPPPSTVFTDGSPNLYSPCLRLTFNPPPRHQQGLIFGWDPQCDIVLPKEKGISLRHGALAFDELNRPIYRDLGSRSGSQVTYTSDGRGRRRGFRWILGGHPIPEERTIILYFTQSLSFQLVVCEHDFTSPQYLDKVNLFRQGTEDVGTLLNRFDIARPETEPVSGAETPGSGPIMLKIKVGEGAFATVYRIWDVSTGVDTALKEPSKLAIRERRVNEDRWKNEDRIMRRLSHPNIVAFLSSDFSVLGHPRLVLEYVPCGSLSVYKATFTKRECLHVLVQCLSALAYLHRQEPHPVVHRDIKPDNILVQARDDSHIHVKLADFGLTKDSSQLTTICGTPLYLAPEIYEESARRNAAAGRDVGHKSFTTAVDLWSTGVVLDDCIYGLPGHDGSPGLNWCREVSRKLRKDAKEHPSILSQLITSMVDMRPERRRSARDLYQHSLTLRDAVESEQEGEDEDEKAGGSQTPTQAAYTDQYNLMPSGDIQAVYFRPALATSPKRPVGQGTVEAVSVCSGAPPRESLPESKGKKRAAASTPSSSSSSSGRRGRHAKRHRHRQQQREGLAEEYVSELFDPLRPLGGGSTLAEAFAEENPDCVDTQSTLTSRESGPRSIRDLHLPAVPLSLLPAVPPSLALAPGDGVDSDEFTAANLLLALRDAE